MILYNKKQFEKDHPQRVKNIYWCNIGVIDGIPDDVWEKLDCSSLEFYAISLLDRYFGADSGLIGIYKTKLPLFDLTSWCCSADVYLVRYGNNGTTNIISPSLDAIKWIKEMNGESYESTRAANIEDIAVIYSPTFLG